MLKKLREKILGEKATKSDAVAKKIETEEKEETTPESVVEKKESKKEKKISNKKTAESEEEKDAKSKKSSVMVKYLNDSMSLPNISDIVEGPVIGIEKGAVYINLHPYGTGIIFGREYISARDIIKKINIGDNIAAKVVDINNKEGYIELSLKEARQALIWSEAEEVIKNKTILELPITEANKGGLLIEWQGITGFLPASQLKTEHYPRVADGDKDKILEELKKLVGQKIAVSIISALPKEGKLIFSEKNPVEKDKEKIIGNYAVGDEVQGTVTGIVDFGVFVKIEEGLEGLVHISEIDWSLVEDPRLLFKVGDSLRVKIIEIREGKISLSAKALKENPWVAASKKYQKDKLVEGVIIKYNKHGALASVEEGIAGLVHISEFGSEAKLREKLELGKTYHFKITLFDPKEQKMALSFIDKEKKK